MVTVAGYDGPIWDVEVRWDGESHTPDRSYLMFQAAQAWCAMLIAELFREGAPYEREAATALITRIENCTGESRDYDLRDDLLGVEVYISAQILPPVS